MQWKNPGHEFDTIGNDFIKNKKLIIIGDNFDQANFYINKSIIDIVEFLNVPVKKIRFSAKGTGDGKISKCKLWLVCKIYKLDKENAIFITHYHHKNRDISYKLVEMLRKIIKKPIYDSITFIEHSMSIFAVYASDKIYARDTCIIITSKCTLNCKYCLNFTPFISHGEDISLETLKSDVDIYFSAVDYVGFFQISGGEPLLYNDLSEFIEWLSKKYGGRIGQILLATNCTLLPDEATTIVLKRYNVLLLLDNYTLSIPNLLNKREKVIDFLKKNAIDFRDYDAEKTFFKFFPPNENYRKLSDAELSARADKCWGLQPYRNLRNGHIYFCNFSSFAVSAGIIQDNSANYFDLKQLDRKHKKLLVEFLLGYSELGYDTFCLLCNGIDRSNNLERSPAGEQAKKKFTWHDDMTLKEYEDLNQQRESKNIR